MIIRVSKSSGNYSIIHNHPLSDPRLSLKAKGLAAYLLSKPDNWNIVVENIECYSQDGRDSIKVGLQELQRAGYLTRKKHNNPQTGQLEWERVMHETPQGDSQIALTIALQRAKEGKRPLKFCQQKGKTTPSTVNPSTVNPSTVNPSTVNPSTVNPSTVNPLQISTDQTITDQAITELPIPDAANPEPSDDDDVSPPLHSLVKEKNPAYTRARVGSRGIRIALTDDAGNWHYDIDFIHRIASSEDEQRSLLRNACILALQSCECHDDWDDLAIYLNNLTARQMQRLITWSYKLTFDTEWSARIDNHIGLIKTKIDTVAALRPWQKPKLAWFFCYCLTGNYEPWTTSQPQQGQLLQMET